jgi:hypothetical protein
VQAGKLAKHAADYNKAMPHLNRVVSKTAATRTMGVECLASGIFFDGSELHSEQVPRTEKSKEKVNPRFRVQKAARSRDIIGVENMTTLTRLFLDFELCKNSCWPP